MLSFVAARLGAERVIGCDISSEAVDRRPAPTRIGWAWPTAWSSATGSLLEPVRDVRADVLIGDVSGIPDEIAQVAGLVPRRSRRRAHRRRAAAARCIEQIGDTLVPGGRLYLPTGTIQDERRIIEAARRLFGDNMEPVMSREFPLPDVVGKSVAVARMMKEGLLSLHKRGSRWLWRLQIWRCATCRPPSPPGRRTATASTSYPASRR